MNSHPADLHSRTAATPVEAANWNAVFALSLSVVGLVTAELLPISLLTPMAADLTVSEGVAGQAVTTSAIVAGFASLFAAAATRQIDRRVVMLAFTGLLVVSSLLTAFAANYPMLLIARVLLGIGIGGFWSMVAAIAMRLVSTEQIPRALSIIFGGVSVAMAVATPTGTFLGDIIGWRGVFLTAAAFGAAAFLWQLTILPSIASTGHARLGTLGDLLKRRPVLLGMVGVMLVFAGHFAFFTYLRPFLETVTLASPRTVSALIFGFGAANVIGTFISGAAIQRSLWLTLLLAPLLMAVLSVALVMVGEVTPVAALLIAGWGFVFGTVPVGWSTWLTRTVPNEPESGGGLHVAVIQLAITAGAGVGGVLLDSSGVLAVLTGAAVLLAMASFVIAIAGWKRN